MTDQFTGRPINIDPFEIIKLLAGATENFSADHHADEGTVTVEYVAVHDQTPCGLKRCAHLPAISSDWKPGDADARKLKNPWCPAISRSPNRVRAFPGRMA
jgi:hypothetical protein